MSTYLLDSPSRVWRDIAHTITPRDTRSWDYIGDDLESLIAHGHMSRATARAVRRQWNTLRRSYASVQPTVRWTIEELIRIADFERALRTSARRIRRQQRDGKISRDTRYLPESDAARRDRFLRAQR